MKALQDVYVSLGLQNPRTFIQSGNVVFKTPEQDLAALAKRIENGIEQSFSFRSDVVLRTTAELRQTIAKNPFANRPDIEPRKLLVTFLVNHPSKEAVAKVLEIQADPEELAIHGRELYIYFPNGMARPKLSLPAIEKILNVSGTGRNWNSLLKLLAVAEELESGP